MLRLVGKVVRALLIRDPVRIAVTEHVVVDYFNVSTLGAPYSLRVAPIYILIIRLTWALL